MYIFKHYGQERYYNADDFPYRNLIAGKSYTGRKKVEYFDTFMTFDIESTSTIYQDEYIGYMYIWQACIGSSDGSWRYVVHGRTWFEWLEFKNRIEHMFGADDEHRIVCYVHNLSYEYQFLRTIQPFSSTFATDKRKVLKATSDGIEFRCSYKLTNMSLDKFCKYTGAKHTKATEYFDYAKLRTPTTPLTELELWYTFCDVVGAHEGICKLLEEDTLASIPLTSTGYVRRDCRNAMKKNPKNWQWFKKCAMTPLVYELIVEAIRGGDTHANRYYAGQILEDVDNYDFSSSYPFCMCCKYYPVTRFTKVSHVKTESDLKLYLSKKCCLFRIYFKNLRIKHGVTNPYISFSKCYSYNAKKTTIYNGRVLSSSVIGMTLTELDYDTIQAEYDWDECGISDLHIADRGLLPKEIREEIILYYEHKTSLKGVDEYLYAKDKNKLNGIFGMAFTNPIHSNYFINAEGEWVEEKPDIAKALKDYANNRNNFLPYAVGIWTTAHARHNLRDLIHIAGEGNAYNDTDSEKVWGIDISEEVSLYNRKVQELAEKYGAYADDRKGVRHYMGVAEKERSYEYFRTWGAKKYAYIQDGELHLTLAGVDKKKGAAQLKDLSDFKLGKIFLPDCGRRTVRYNDWQTARYITVDGCTFLTGAGVHMENGTYELGVTDEFLESVPFSVDYLNEL